MTNTKSFDIPFEQIMEAFERVKANKGTYGIDKESIQAFEANLYRNLYVIWNRMSSGSYFPMPVKAVSIPKKSGGERILGIPTIRDRIAQTVVKMQLEPKLESLFDNNSYGFRPGRSAHQALLVTRQRCWKWDWVLEFDIRKLFDCLCHKLMMKAVRHHTQSKWILLYVERWLKAPMQLTDGKLEIREAGVPQGGPISPLLANLFMHYAFDAWMRKRFPNNPFVRYADDGLVHCRTQEEARVIYRELSLRLKSCGLEIHPDKTSVVYCQDSNRKYKPEAVNNQFTFLGYTFRPRAAKGVRNEVRFTSFLPAISADAERSIKEKMRKWKLKKRVYLSLKDIAGYLKPYIQGWMNYYCVFYKSQFQRISSHINESLMRWAMHKFKRLRRREGKARDWLIKIAKSEPNLFPHWREGFTRIG